MLSLLEAKSLITALDVQIPEGLLAEKARAEEFEEKQKQVAADGDVMPDGWKLKGSFEDLHKQAKDEAGKRNFDKAFALLDNCEKLLKEPELPPLPKLPEDDKAKEPEKPVTAKKGLPKLPVAREKMVKGKRLGQGSFGNVYDIDGGEGAPPMVIKTIEKEGGEADLQAEVAAYEKIGENDNIAKCYGIQEVEGKRGMVMEKISGGGLDEAFKDLQKLKKDGKISHEEFWGAMQHMMAGTLKGLAHMEKAGMVHNDMKSNNVMFDFDTMQPKIIDFGLTKGTGEAITSSGQNPLYGAPEKVIGQEGKANPKQDAFSAGYMLHGETEGKGARFGREIDPKLNFGPMQAYMAAAQFMEPEKSGESKTILKPAKPGEEAAKPGKYAEGYQSAYVDFLNQLMHPDPTKRLSAEQALEHPFMKDALAQDPEVATSALKKIKAERDGTVAAPTAPDPAEIKRKAEAAAADQQNVRLHMDAAQKLVESAAATREEAMKKPEGITLEQVRSFAKTLSDLKQAEVELSADRDKVDAAIKELGGFFDQNRHALAELTAKEKKAKLDDKSAQQKAALEKQVAEDQKHQTSLLDPMSKLAQELIMRHKQVGNAVDEFDKFMANTKKGAGPSKEDLGKELKAEVKLDESVDMEQTLKGIQQEFAKITSGGKGRADIAKHFATLSSQAGDFLGKGEKTKAKKPLKDAGDLVADEKAWIVVDEGFKATKTLFDTKVPGGSGIPAVQKRITAVESQLSTALGAGETAKAAKLLKEYDSLTLAEITGAKKKADLTAGLKGLKFVKEGAFSPGTAAKLGKEKLKAGKEFKRVLDAMIKLEKDVSDESLIEGLEKAARAYIVHYKKDLNDREKKQKESLRKREICLEALKKAKMLRLSLKHEKLDLEKEPWDEEKEKAAKELHAESLLLEGSLSQLGDSEGSGESESYFLKDGGGKRAYIFKPSSGENDAGYGWKKGGGAAREVMLSALNDQMKESIGLDFGVSPTQLIELEDEGFTGGKNNKDANRVGALQNIIESEGNLSTARDVDPDLKKKIPTEDVQKVMLLDFISLNLDRQPDNFLVQRDATGKPRLIPIDAGNAMPPKKAFEASGRNFQANEMLTTDQAKEKFSPEMLEKIDALDEDKIVKGLKKANDDMVAKNKDMKGMIEPDEELEMSRRSIMFLKKAVKAPYELTVAELGEAYSTVFKEVINAPDKKLDAAIDLALKKAKARKDQFAQLEQMNYKQELDKLGWPKDESFLTDDPQRLFLILKDKRANPAIEKECVRLTKELGGLSALKKLGIDPSKLTTREKFNRLKDARAKQDRDFVLNDPDLAKKAAAHGVGSEASEDKKVDALNRVKEFEEWNKGDKLKKMKLNPKKMTFPEKQEAMFQSKFEAMGGEKRLEQIESLHVTMSPNKTYEEKLKVLNEAKEYQALGGDDVYVSLGGLNVKMTWLNKKLIKLKDLKTLA